MGESLSGAHIIWEALVREGVDVCFGYPGGAIMPAYDAMIEYPIHHVLTRHEQGASHMADGYARASGEVGVCIATSGPGATNLVTGIATAMLDSIPMVCITGQVPSQLIGSDAFQETDITGCTIPVTKHNYLVTKAEQIAPTIREAFYIARSGRDAVELIKNAKRPILFSGHGVVKAQATETLMEFVEKTNIPVACTLLGLGGFPATHPRNLGMMGMHGEIWVNKAIQEADLIIAVGMRFDDRVTGNLKTYAQNAKKIHIELDPAEINKNVHVDVPIVGDARTILKKLLPHVDKCDRPEWLAYIEKIQGGSTVKDIKNLPDMGKLYAAHVIHDLYRLTEGKALVVTDVGQHQMWEAQYYKHDYPRKLITSGGLGTMGFALPAAIGAKFAKPDDSVWVICGDGGFQMTQAELSTCAQEGIKVNVAIINNGFLGMVRQWQEFFFGGRYVATPMLSPDFVKIADAHALTGIRVEKRSEVEEAVRKAEATEGTVVIDFRVEQEDSVYPMVPAGADLGDMIERPHKPGTHDHNPIFETGEDD
ncbi:MAG: acetolactate synthase large subunit [Deltaproteobacteria bacterium]|nr:acetolactate synthase large subunit [Deltaproteobacteria bacterium]